MVVNDASQRAKAPPDSRICRARTSPYHAARIVTRSVERTEIAAPSAMDATVAFIAAPLCAAPRRCATAARFTCSATGPRRRVHKRLAAVTAALLSVVAFNPRLPFRGARFVQGVREVEAKELRYDGRQELDSKERAFSLVLTAGTFAALGVWAWKQNRRDDELEEIRIREEVERLEKLRQEFMDVEEDEDAMDDEDLLASLRERLGEDGRRAENDGEGEGDAGDSDSTTAVMDKDDADAPSADSVDMLKRMWEATDDDNKRDDKKPSA
eukprot:TRINITY_DN505_c0_g1_i1.p5 TRINITY_DN505_c0_g1~~TRINITY_DN505_c0_g1_i1.p5  ORF type:complete len:269 (+),score=65.08 TRINITY_DN505_c0_g1_i1:5202-6008(+)